MDLADAYAQLRAGPIKDQADLHALFAAYLREPPTAQQETDIDQIVTLVHGHTLALELTARQIAASHLSLEQAAERIRSRGILRWARKSCTTSGIIIRSAKARKRSSASCSIWQGWMSKAWSS